MAGKRLWTPGGMMPLEQDVIPLTQTEMQALANMHEPSQKFQWAVVCRACDQSLQGANDGVGNTFVVKCGCREYKFVGPSVRGR